MGLKDAIMGKSGADYLTDYTKKRMAEEEAKKPKKIDMGKTRGGSSKAGKEADMALNDEYEQ